MEEQLYQMTFTENEIALLGRLVITANPDPVAQRLMKRFDDRDYIPLDRED